ncbi:unnamed protein product [Trichobilharzia regenti]|nr:unnamed protein product [Trichobilharzia regenti]
MLRVKRFPLIEIHSCLIGPNPSLSSSLQSTVREFIINNKTGQSSNCLTVYSDIEYVLRIELLRSSLDNEYYGNKPVITASLIKSKSYEGWFLLLGNCEVNINTGGELLVLKRVPPKSVVIHKKHHTSKGKHFINLMVKFPPPITLTPSSADSNRGVDGIIPSLECRQRYQLTLFLMSDTYLGLDQQIDLLFDVIRKPPPPPPPENDKDDGDFVGDDDYDDDVGDAYDNVDCVVNSV